MGCNVHPSDTFPIVPTSIQKIQVGLVVPESGQVGTTAVQIEPTQSSPQKWKQPILQQGSGAWLGVASLAVRVKTPNSSQPRDKKCPRMYSIRLKMRAISNKEFTALVKDTDTVDDLKNKIAGWTNIHPSRQNLVGPRGKSMQDGQPLINFKLEEGSEINVVERHDVIPRVAHLESEIRSLHLINEKVCELEKGVSFLSDRFQSVRHELKKNHDDMTGLKETVRTNTDTTWETRQRLIDLENRSMRDNLLFTGVPETPHEDTEHVIRNIIQDKLGIRDNISFERVHRIGRYNQAQANRPRTIVMKFSRFKDRETVRSHARKLKGTQIGIHEQFGKEINDKRKILYPQFKAAREKKKYARLVYDHLIVDNEKYKVDNRGSVYRDPSYNRPPPSRNTQQPSGLTRNPDSNNNNNNRRRMDNRPPNYMWQGHSYFCTPYMDCHSASLSLLYLLFLTYQNAAPLAPGYIALPSFS